MFLLKTIIWKRFEQLWAGQHACGRLVLCDRVQCSWQQDERTGSGGNDGGPMTVSTSLTRVMPTWWKTSCNSRLLLLSCSVRPAEPSRVAATTRDLSNARPEPQPRLARPCMVVKEANGSATEARLAPRPRVSSKQSNFFFRFEPKQTENQSVSVVFRFVSRNQKTFFGFISVCFGVLDWYRNNWNKQNFLKTNRKNLQKTFSIRGSSKPLIFFLGLDRNKPKLNLFQLFFGLLFRKTNNFFFGLFRFVSMFRTGIKTTEANRTYGMGN
jgi:hypothetical protein